MAYRESIRSAIEKLRVKILGASETVGLWRKGPNDRPVEMATLTRDFFYERITDLAGEEYLKLEAVIPEGIDPLAVQSVTIRGYRHKVAVHENPMDSVDLFTFKLSPTGERT